MAYEILFEVETPLGFRVRTSPAYWHRISQTKHQELHGRIEDVRATLGNPDEVYFSKTDRTILLFYRRISAARWLCAVAKRLNGTGFLVTAYISDAIKEGEQIWTK